MAKINEKLCTYEGTLRCINSEMKKKCSLKWRKKVTKFREVKRRTERWKNIAYLNRKDE